MKIDFYEMCRAVRRRFFSSNEYGKMHHDDFWSTNNCYDDPSGNSLIQMPDGSWIKNDFDIWQNINLKWLAGQYKSYKTKEEALKDVAKKS